MTVKLTASAVKDLEDGARFYERKESGLGSYFLDTLHAEIDALRSHAGVHRIVFGKHRFHSKRFPHAIYYVVRNEVIEVRAIIDSRRDPSRTNRMLRRR